MKHEIYLTEQEFDKVLNSLTRTKEFKMLIIRLISAPRDGNKRYISYRTTFKDNNPISQMKEAVKEKVVEIREKAKTDPGVESEGSTEEPTS